MNVQELLEKRKSNWAELETLCVLFEKRRKNSSEKVIRFSSLYRCVCADLALAESYQLPSSVVDRLQHLVGRAHSVLYSAKQGWFLKLLSDLPKAVITDPYVHISFFIFWGVFISLCLLVQNDAIPGLAETVVGAEQLEAARLMHSDGDGTSGRQVSLGQGAGMTGFYVYNNAGIGLMCFATSVLVVPGLTVLVSNAATLGTIFGYLLRPGYESESFQTFVLAHGPFELTAIILSAGAGLRLGMSLVDTRGLTRYSSFLYASKKALPVLVLAVALFCGAAVIEGMISGQGMPFWERGIKGTIGVMCSWMLSILFVVMGILLPYMRGEFGAEDIGYDVRGEDSWT